MKFIYRKQFEIFGSLIEETATHYIIETENDSISLKKEVTTIEKVATEIETIKTNSSFKEITGLVVRTSKKIYVIKENGLDDVTVYKLDLNGGWNRYFEVNKKTLKGGAHLPNKVKEKILETTFK